MTGRSAEIPTAIQKRCLIICLRMSLSWSMVAVVLGFDSAWGLVGSTPLALESPLRHAHFGGAAGVAGAGAGAGAGVAAGAEPAAAFGAAALLMTFSTSREAAFEAFSMSVSLGRVTTVLLFFAS